MAGNGSGRLPSARLSLRERITFMRIIDHETNPHGRRMLDTWARPGDARPHADRLLGETLKLMWRTPAE